MPLRKPKVIEKIPGRWALRDMNGKYLLRTLDYGPSGSFFSARDVFSWTGLEDASLLDHAEAEDCRAMFPAGSAVCVEVLRREAV